MPYVKAKEMKKLTIILACAATLSCNKQPVKECTEREISSLILQEERPLMGLREQTFWLDVIEETSKRHNNSMVVSVSKIAQESKFRQQSVSYAGAKGPAQIMPLWLTSDLGECKGIDPFEIEAALNCGAKILAIETAKAKGDLKLALQFYNGGDKSANNPQTKAYANEVLARAYLATLKCKRS